MKKITNLLAISGFITAMALFNQPKFEQIPAKPFLFGQKNIPVYVYSTPHAEFEVVDVVSTQSLTDVFIDLADNIDSEYYEDNVLRVDYALTNAIKKALRRQRKGKYTFDAIRLIDNDNAQIIKFKTGEIKVSK